MSNENLNPLEVQTKKFNSFNEFYPFYLSEHSQKGTRVVHFIGTLFAIVSLLRAAVVGDPRIFIVGVLFTYLLLWISHLTIEKNKPATFKYPVYSFLGDLKMFYELLRGKLKF